jgi:hypothetical protein
MTTRRTLREDAEELFGRSAQAPIDVGDGQEGEGGAANKEEGEEDENSAKRSRPSTSVVWLQKLFKTVKGKKVRYAAKCIHCSKQYSALSLVVALVTSPSIGINV